MIKDVQAPHNDGGSTLQHITLVRVLARSPEPTVHAKGQQRLCRRDEARKTQTQLRIHAYGGRTLGGHPWSAGTAEVQRSLVERTPRHT